MYLWYLRQLNFSILQTKLFKSKKSRKIKFSWMSTCSQGSVILKPKEPMPYPLISMEQLWNNLISLMIICKPFVMFTELLTAMECILWKIFGEDFIIYVETPVIPRNVNSIIHFQFLHCYISSSKRWKDIQTTMFPNIVFSLYWQQDLKIQRQFSSTWRAQCMDHCCRFWTQELIMGIVRISIRILKCTLSSNNSISTITMF